MTDSSPDLPDDRNPQWWSARWVKITVVLLISIFAFYTSSNWIGAARWNQVKTEVATAGESLDPNAIIPPPVPDDKNFGALPIFQLTGIPPDLQATDLRSALALVDSFPYSAKDHEPKSLPYLGRWTWGETGDPVLIDKQLRLLCKRAGGAEPTASASPLDLFAQLCPALADLRTADPLRPECRFNIDYTSQPVFNRSFSGITEQIKLAKALGYEETLALRFNRPDLALADLKVMVKIDAGLSREPLLISGLVALGCTAIQLEPMAEGLGRHLWSDSQLAQLDESLGHIDRLSQSQLCTRGEASFLISTVDFTNAHRHLLATVTAPSPSLGIPHSVSSLEDLLQAFLRMICSWLVPSGWFDQFKADGIHLYYSSVIPAMDPSHHRVYPEKIEQGLSALDKSPGSEMWHHFENSFLGSTGNSIRNFTLSQVQVDEARIVCRLERYRLAHGNYPPSLDDLTAYGSPSHDPLSGLPYHYQLQKDGTFLLYSVGWDQKDNGGTGRGVSTTPVRDAPDWLWNDSPKPAP